MKRELIGTLDRRKEMMIAALWANSGFEGSEGADARRSMIEEIENQFDEATKRINLGTVEEEEQIDHDNPFFQAAKKGMSKLDSPRNDEGTVREVIDYTKDIDQ